VRAEFNLDLWIVYENLGKLVEFNRRVGTDVRAVEIIVYVLKNKHFVELHFLKNYSRVKRDVCNKLRESFRIYGLPFRSIWLAFYKVAISLSDEFVAFILINSEEEFTISSCNVILHQLTFTVEE